MPYDYMGNELELFAKATHWKSYWGRLVSRFVAGRVLEVGAGIGSNIPVLHNPNVRDWLALEPDYCLVNEMTSRLRLGALPPNCRISKGTLLDVPNEERFDTILYIDVLEHIEDDRAEVARAADLLAPTGRIVVLAPAHQFLFSPFDRAIGHYRRYGLSSLRGLTPNTCRVVNAFMLDSIGLFASLVNRLVLHSAMPTLSQVNTWDNVLVPASRILDPITGFRIGKSAVIVWQAESPNLGN